MALVDITNSTVENNVDINTTENTQTIDVIQEPDQTIGIESVESNQDVLVVQEENQQDIQVDLPTGGVGLRGYSAYEIAVQNGFKGTEQEWLKSLEGEDGSTPYIQNGYWYIDGVNTTIKAEGKDGVSVSITKTSSVVVSGEKRTTVEFSDGTSITIHDGKNGADGTDGTSVTIISISESPDDDGKNIIVFSDGSTLSIKNGKRGDKGDKGEGFSISKTYSSIAEMNSGFATDGVPINGFVLINTGNIQDEDNAKLFVKLESGYSYLIDLSGAQGIKGDKGDRGDKGDTYTLNEDDINNIAQEAANKIDVDSFQRKEDNLLETNSQEVVRGINELLSNIVGDRTWVFDDNLNGAPDFVAEFNFSVLFPTGNIGYFDKMEGYTTNGQYTLRYYGNGGIVRVYEGIWKFPQHQTIIAKTVPDVVKDIATLQVYNVDELLNTNAQTIYGALNELLSKCEEASEELEKIELDTVGRCWVLQGPFRGTEDFDIDLDFTSNNTEFTQIRYVYLEDEYGSSYRLLYRNRHGNRYTPVYDVYDDGSGEEGGWTDPAYQTIFTDDIYTDLSNIAEERETSLKEQLLTYSKTLAGAINEINAKVVKGYKKPGTNEWYQDESFSTRLDVDINASFIAIDLLTKDVSFGLISVDLVDLIVGLAKESEVGKWFDSFVGTAGNFITSLWNEIRRWFTEEKIETLETEAKIVPFAVNEVNSKVNDVVEGRTKVTASTADKLIAARKITFSGDVSGELSFDGSKDENVEITVIGEKCSNLTGTTWRIRSGWEATAGDSQYLIKYKATVGDNVYNSTAGLFIGYTFVNIPSETIVLPTAQQNSIVFAIDTGKFIPIDPSQEFTLEITGGIQVTNTNLIDWLYKYGELESPYQTKVDENLETESKEIVGAINELNEKAHYCSQGLSYALSEDETYYTVSGVGTCKDAEVIIPAVYKGKPVTNIGQYAFVNCTWITKVTLPNSITTITGSAFSGCTALEYINIPKGVTVIGYWAFLNCSSAKIYCEAEAQPSSGWNSYWNPDNRPVVYGCKFTFGELNEKIGEGVDTSNLATLDKINLIDNWVGDKYDLYDAGPDGIIWSEQFLMSDAEGNELASGKASQRIPLRAGNNVEFEVDEEQQVVKINAEVDTSNLATVDKVTNFNFASGNCSEVGINSDGKGVEWKNDELEIELAPDNEGNVNYHYAQVYERIPIVAGNNIDFEVDEENQVVKINAEGTVDKITNLDFASGSVTDVYIEEYGIVWGNDEVEIEITDEDIKYYYPQNRQKIPIVAGDNITFELDDENQVVKVNAEVDTSNLATVDKVASVDTWVEGVSELYADEGISWRDSFMMSDANGDVITSGKIYHRVPIVAGNNIEFEVIDHESGDTMVKINASGGGTPDNVILKYEVELTGSEMVTDIINQLRGKGYQLATFGFVEFSGATSGLYGLTINHYGGNVYNIGGIDFGTFYTMANNVTDWSTVSLWPFLSMFQPPIPYCDDSNNGQVLKVVNGVPTWTNL